VNGQRWQASWSLGPGVVCPGASASPPSLPPVPLLEHPRSPSSGAQLQLSSFLIDLRISAYFLDCGQLFSHLNRAARCFADPSCDTSIMAQYFFDLLYNFTDCMCCFPSSPQLKINSRSFKLLRLLGEVCGLSFAIFVGFRLTMGPHLDREAFPTYTSSKTSPHQSYSPSRRSDAHSARNPCRRR
jgi:hypothetical protein